MIQSFNRNATGNMWRITFHHITSQVPHHINMTFLYCIIIFILSCGLNFSSACFNGSPAVGTCLHVYLERDFPSIEAIVYRNGTGPTENPLLLDGPELAEQCRRMEEVITCLEELQYSSSCYFYQDFFTFRHLVKSLRRSINWVCQDLRNRFRKLLDSFHCIEKVRLDLRDGHTCYRASLKPNLWQRIIRLQTGTEVCPDLQSQINCVTSGKFNLIRNRCLGAEEVYRNLTKVFLDEWCTNSAGLLTPVHFLLLPLTISVYFFV